MRMFVSCPRGRTFDSFFDVRNIELAERLFDVVWNPFDRNVTPEEAALLGKDCDVYMTSWGAPVPNGSFLKEAPNLRVVAHLGTSTEHIEKEAVANKGVKILSGEEYYNHSAAEGTLAYILSALRSIPEFSLRLKYKGEWKHKWDKGRGLMGKTVGLFNYNGIAAHLAQMLSPFGVRILVYDRETIPGGVLDASAMEQVSGEMLFALSDIICIYSPASGDAYHMVGNDLLWLVKTGALLVDISVGGTVDRDALLGMLLRKDFFAVLDVFEKEPPDKNDELILLQNVLPMPHMAGPTPDIRRIIAKELLIEAAEVCNAKK